MDLKALRNDDRAVSPVIGVILMVAITVILAAVIGTFVLGLGDQVGDTTPNNSLSLDADSTYAAGTAGGDRFATIDHRTGSSVDSADIQIIIRDGQGDPLARFTELADGTDTAGEGDTIVVDIGGETNVFEVGDRISLSTNEANVNGFAGGDDIQVTVIHDPSDGNMMDDSVTLATNAA